MGGAYTKFQPKLVNKTGLDWTLSKSAPTQGYFDLKPPGKIKNGEEGSFRAFSQHDCVCNSAGEVVYSIPDGTKVNITWLINYGSAGSASFDMLPEGNNANSYESIAENTGQKSGGAYSTYEPKLTLQLDTSSRE